MPDRRRGGAHIDRNADMDMTDTRESQAQALIRATGARLTRPRTRVLGYLLDQPRALSHHEILAALPGEQFDAVTLYRVLEWLTEHGIAHRIEGADHVWRFSADAGNKGHGHAHFHCTRCEAVTCMSGMPLPSRLKLPEGFTSEEVSLLIKGTCPRCSS